MNFESTESSRSKRCRTTSRPTRSALVVLCALVGIGVVACSNSPTFSESSASCAYSVIYKDTSYINASSATDFEIGERLGTATIPPCNDTGGHETEPIGSMAVYRVEGLDPTQAIAVHDGPNGKLLLGAMTNGAFSPTVQAFIAEANPNGSVLAAPDRGLDDGATVTVTVRGLDTDTGMIVGQCAPVAGNFACLPAATDDLAHVVTTTSMPPPPSGDGGPRAPTTAVDGPESVTTFTMTVHNPLRGDLELSDAKGNPVTGASVPDQVDCRGDDPVDTTFPRCLIAVRGNHDGFQVVRYAPIRFAGGGPATPTPEPPTS